MSRGSFVCYQVSLRGLHVGMWCSLCVLPRPQLCVIRWKNDCALSFNVFSGVTPKSRIVSRDWTSSCDSYSASGWTPEAVFASYHCATVCGSFFFSNYAPNNYVLSCEVCFVTSYKTKLWENSSVERYTCTSLCNSFSSSSLRTGPGFNSAVSDMVAVSPAEIVQEAHVRDFGCLNY